MGFWDRVVLAGAETEAGLKPGVDTGAVFWAQARVGRALRNTSLSAWLQEATHRTAAGGDLFVAPGKKKKKRNSKPPPEGLPIRKTKQSEKKKEERKKEVARGESNKRANPTRQGHTGRTTLDVLQKMKSQTLLFVFPLTVERLEGMSIKSPDLGLVKGSAYGLGGSILTFSYPPPTHTHILIMFWRRLAALITRFTSSGTLAVWPAGWLPGCLRSAD